MPLSAQAIRAIAIRNSIKRKASQTEVAPKGKKSGKVAKKG